MPHVYCVDASLLFPPFLFFSFSAMPRDTDVDQCLNGQRMDKTAGQDEGVEGKKSFVMLQI